MSDELKRMTEDELQDIEIKAPRFMDGSVVQLFAGSCLDLVAEVRRLRGLIVAAAADLDADRADFSAPWVAEARAICVEQERG